MAHRLRHRELGAALRRFDAILSPSEYVAGVFRGEHPGLAVEVSDYGIDVRQVRRDALRAREGEPRRPGDAGRGREATRPPSSGARARVHATVDSSSSASGGVPAPPARVLFCGTLIPEKGADLLLDALERLAPGTWRACIHGDPAVSPGYGARIRARAEGLGVEMAGPYPPGRAGRVLGRGDLLVVPSRWWDRPMRSTRRSR